MKKLCTALGLHALLLFACTAASTPQPLRIHPTNPRYFTDGSGKAIYLTGIQYEDALREDGTPVPTAVDYADFLETVGRYNLNFVRLWRWSELVRFREITNETGHHSTEWQYHIVRSIRSYEAGKLKQHPVGMSFQYPGGSNRALFASPADWIAPGEGYRNDPPAADGTKVILSDTDHLGGTPGSKVWVWQSFLRGLNPINYGLMALGSFREKPIDLEEAARAMGHTRTLANRMNLAEMTPRGDLTSTGFCLANAGTEYLVYQPKGGEGFSVELKKGTYRYTWFNPAKGEDPGSGNVEAAGGAQPFKAPFAGDAVLYLRKAD